MTQKIIFLFSFLIFSTVFAMGQKQYRVMGRPIKFDTPKDLFSEQDRELYKEYISKVGNIKEDEPWVVYSDRRRNITYNEPDQNSGNFKQLEFGDYYYVIKEQGDWIHIVSGRAVALKIDERSYKDMGWIEKKNMLLWSYGIRDKQSNIHRKVFLLNKLDEALEVMAQNKRDSTFIYAGPSTNFKTGSQKLYDFFFIYKKEDDRYLIAGESKISSKNAKRKLVGWVPRAKAVEWNTRISLEPNYEQSAFAERLEEENKRVVGFNDDSPQTVVNYITTGIIDTRNVIWDSDPIKCDRDKLSSANPRRYKGGVIRFPLISQHETFYRTGTVGDVKASTFFDKYEDIDDINYGEIQDYIARKTSKLNNYNIFFLVEGTRELSVYKKAIMSAIENIEFGFDSAVKIKYGVGVYRDLPEKPLGKDFELLPLTLEKQKALDFVNNIEFNNWNDFEEYTIAYYGLMQSLVKGGFSSEHSNIVFVLGNNADLSKDRLRKDDPESKSSGVLIEREDLYNKLADLEIDIFTIRGNNENSIKANRGFRDNGKSLIIESAKRQFFRMADLKEQYSGAVIPNPNLENSTSAQRFILINGTNAGEHYDPMPKASLSSKDLQDFVLAKVKESQAKTSSWVETLNNMVDGESIEEGISSGDLEPAVLRELVKLYKRNARKNQNMESDLQKMVKEKYKFYTPLLVAKKARGAKSSLFSYVMFMPKEDLDSYISELRNVEQEFDNSPDRKREALYFAYRNLISQYTGNKEIRAKDLKKTKSSELTEYMQGLKLEGLEIDEKYQFEIGNILDRKKISNERLEQIISNILRKKEGLEKIRNAPHYEFSYRTDNNIYYWIPIEFAL